MGYQVSFDYAAWLALYPEFDVNSAQPVSEAQANLYFTLAGALHANDGGGPVTSAALQSAYMNMVTAHVAKLNAQLAGGAPNPGLVGRISDASEGSVSVRSEYSSQVSQSQAFWVQTSYGAMYWAATAQYRTFRYSPLPTVVVPGPYPFAGGRW